MFTGIIESLGRVVSLDRDDLGGRLRMQAPFAAELETGESVATNGVCLTVTELHDDGGEVCFDILEETLRVTGLGDLAPGGIVNLERAIRAGDRMSGHFVQGHVDATAEVVALEKVGNDYRYQVAMPEAFARLMVYKGSIAIDGISLTVAELGEGDASFTCWITPHTFDVTNLSTRKAGDRVNLEFDILGKYVARQLEAQR